MSLQQDQFSNNARLNMTERGFDVTRGTHGTVFVEGMTEVNPGNEVGRNNFPEFSRTNRTYYTAHSTPKRIEKGMDLNKLPREEEYFMENNPDPEVNKKRARESAELAGWHWASMGVGKVDDKHAVTGQKVLGRKVVHEVEAVGHIDEDPILNQAGLRGAEMTADKLHIKDTHWIPDKGWGGNEDSVVQGTLPNYNWNRQAPLEGEGEYRGADTTTDYNSLKYSPKGEWRTRMSEERRNINAAQFNQKARERGNLVDMGQMQLPGIEG